MDLACRLARQALGRDRREYGARCRPLVEAAARAQEIIPADELEAGTVREAPAPLYVLEGVFFVRGERVWNVRMGRVGVVVADAGREDSALVILWDGDQTPQRIDDRHPEADAISTAEPCTVRELVARYAGDPRWIVARDPGTCRRCGGPVPAGARGFYYPHGRTLLCEECGGPAAAEFEEAARLEASGAYPW